MNADYLIELINEAQIKAYEVGYNHENVVVYLNQTTFQTLRRVYDSWAFSPHTPCGPHFMEVCGALVSWSPLHNDNPNSYSVGIKQISAAPSMFSNKPDEH